MRKFLTKPKLSSCTGLQQHMWNDASIKHTFKVLAMKLVKGTMMGYLVCLLAEHTLHKGTESDRQNQNQKILNIKMVVQCGHTNKKNHNMLCCLIINLFLRSDNQIR